MHGSSVVVPEDIILADDPFVAVLEGLQPVLVAHAGRRQQTHYFVGPGRRCLKQTRSGLDHVTDSELVPVHIVRFTSNAQPAALSMRPDVRAPVSLHRGI
jgi:hypothetical protein